jgi:aryl-alcohol dehydrogenase-like predicted oxidoreductase
VGIAYLLHQTLEVYPIAGCRSVKHLEELVAACEVKLSPGQLAWLETGR